ncbi:hypothetical protein HYW18_02585 [Candidatus Uhrbacteria bacterium]|nr:hypothetical protein [Candidatus Uhrbacteria bacterium]
MPFERGGHAPDQEDWLDEEPKPTRTMDDALAELEQFPIQEHPREVHKRQAGEKWNRELTAHDSLDERSHRITDVARMGAHEDEVIEGAPSEKEVIEKAILARDRARRASDLLAAKHVMSIKRSEDKRVEEYGTMDAAQEALMHSTHEEDITRQAEILSKMKTWRESLSISGEELARRSKAARDRETARLHAIEAAKIGKTQKVAAGSAYLKSLEQAARRAPQEPQSAWRNFWHGMFSKDRARAEAKAQRKMEERMVKNVTVVEKPPTFLGNLWRKVTGAEAGTRRSRAYRKNIQNTYGTNAPSYTSETTLAHLQGHPRPKEQKPMTKKESARTEKEAA